MIQEVRDSFQLLTAVHKSIDKMLENLPDEDWTRKPLPQFNSVAAVIDHITRVEQKFVSAIAGQVADINTAEPFQVDSWDVQAIRTAWGESLPHVAAVYETLQPEQLSEPGLKVGMGELNKRQLMSNAIAHAAHHRGQIPLIQKLLVHHPLES